jgi:hypothetical protein
MKKFLNGHTLLIFLLVLCIQLVLHLFLSNREVSLTPPGRVHTMLPIDMYYPSIIRQSSLRSSWAIVDTNTTLPAPKVYAYVFFIVAGKIAALTHIDPVSMYELLRTIGGIVLIIATYSFITILLPPSLHVLAILLTMVIDTGPVWADILHLPIMQWAPSMPDQAAIARYFILPHHLWGKAFGLTLLCFILYTLKKPKATLLIIVFLLGLVGTTILPSYFSILMSCLLIPWLIYAAITKNLKKTIPPVLIALMGIVLGGLWIKYDFGKGPPYTDLVAVEKSWWTNSEILIPFLQSLTLFYPFVAFLLFLAPFNWSKWPKNIRLAAFLALCWSVIPVGLILISKEPWFPIANGRIASDVTSVPVGILATLGVYALWHASRSTVIFKKIAVALLIIIMSLSLLLSASYFRQKLDAQERAVNGEGYSWILYPSFDLWNAVMALKKVPLYSHVMINPRVGELLPAYVPVRSYQSEPLTFVDWPIRRGLSYLFYTGELTPEDRDKLLSVNKISYIFYGPEEKTALKTKAFYPGVFDVFYKNQEVTIYKVR